MKRFLVCAACLFAVEATAFGGVFRIDPEEVKKFLSDNFDVETTELFSFDVFIKTQGFEAWSFGGLRMDDYDVSGLVDPNGVVNFASTNEFITTDIGDIIVKPLANVFEPGEFISPDLGFGPTTFYPTIPNLPVFFGVGITDPHIGWLEVILSDGSLGTAPTILSQGVQPIPDVGIRAGADPIPEPATLALVALGVGVLMRRRRRAA